LATPEKRNNSGIDQILTSSCCTRQNKHTDIKTVAYNHVTAILQRCQKGQKRVVFLLLFLLLSHTFYFHAISQELTIADTNIINTLPEPFWPTDVPFVGYNTESKDLGAVFGRKIDS